MLRWLRARIAAPLTPKRGEPARSAIARSHPGVYIEEISTRPWDIGAADTAIPVFVGIAETGIDPARVASLQEYETRFGGAPYAQVRFTVNQDGTLADPEWRSLPAYLLYHSVAHFFANGGQACHIVPAGSYGVLPSRAEFEEALERTEQIDGATLFAMSDALSLSPADYAALASNLFDRCAARTNAFAVLDLSGMPDPPTVADFRQRIGGALSYGAVYTPFLETSFAPTVDEETVEIAWQDESRAPTRLGALDDEDAVLRDSIAARLAELRIVQPPSGAVVGAICTNDRRRGVWKAPANLPLAATARPVVDIGNAEQDSLNVDPASGKSINAIRSFSGKGTMIWGARTLAGNDNEVRYVPVRRLLGTIETSLREGLAGVVFEPNEERTWRRVGASVETFLTGLWRAGALSGGKPEHAFYIAVGLGRSMTAQDILEGRLVLEIGVAATRPAEFIVLRIVFRLPAA
jgi:hypothetical protein